MEGFTPEQMAQIEAMFETRGAVLLAGADDKIKAALHEAEQERGKMVFGLEKRGIEELSGDELSAQWFMHSVLATNPKLSGAKMVEHQAKAYALARHSWQNTKDLRFIGYKAKALTIATEGADLTPVEYIAQMIEKAKEISELFPFVRQVPITSDTGTVPKENAGLAVTWGRTEASAMTLDTPTYAQVAFTAYEAYIIGEVSYMMLQDSPLNIIADVVRRFQNAMIAESDKMIAIGSGTNQPDGISSASITQSVTISNSITFAGLVDIVKKLPAKYRRNARWIGHTSVIDEINGLVDLQNRPIFKDAVVNGESAKIYGYPFSRDDNLPTTDLWLGDLDFYYWFDRMKLTMSSDSGGKYFEAGTTAIKQVMRVDGTVALVDAFARGKSITGV